MLQSEMKIVKQISLEKPLFHLNVIIIATLLLAAVSQEKMDVKGANL